MSGRPRGHDPFDLERFVAAQERTYARARDELARGRKESHWMWFVFPQVKGLGHSATSELYGIASRAEASAYLAHPVLGARLIEATELVLGHSAWTLHAILGSPDDMKFCSSMTLFAEIAGDESVFETALSEMCGGARCERTLAMLAGT